MIDTINTFVRKIPTWVVYLLYVLPIPYFFYSAQTGGMGVEPINALEREMGQITLQLIIIGLAITPLRKYFGLNLLKFRRAIGVLAFTYVVVHLGIKCQRDTPWRRREGGRHIGSTKCGIKVLRAKWVNFGR